MSKSGGSGKGVDGISGTTAMGGGEGRNGEDPGVGDRGVEDRGSEVARAEAMGSGVLDGTRTGALKGALGGARKDTLKETLDGAHQGAPEGALGGARKDTLKEAPGGARKSTLEGAPGGAGGAAGHDVIAGLAALSEDERRATIGALPNALRHELLERWVGGWAQPGQVPPAGDWRVWLIRAGRGFGKTRAGAEWVNAMARQRGAQIALVGGTIRDVEQVMIRGPSGLIAVAAADHVPVYRITSGEVVWPTGAKGFVYAAETPDKLRGPEHDAAWCDELAKWRRGEATWDNLMMGLRRGNWPRVVVTTTPRPTALMKRVMRMRGVVETGGRTRDNAYLAAAFTDYVEDQYGGTPLGRQELDGELIEDVEGALWTRALIAQAVAAARPAALVRVVVGVDPPAGTASGQGGDACGIVAVALGDDDRGYVLEDASVAAASPKGWARAVADCAARHGADRVVAEANQGGEMVRSVLHAADCTLPVKLVRASRGKVARAEPVAALYERGRVAHAARFPRLEDELCGLIAGGGYEGPGRSPDRADALVWAVTELLLARRAKAGVRGFS